MKILRKILLVVFVLFVINAQGQRKRKINFLKDSIDKYIAQGMADWNIPGMAVIIVKDDKVVWMKGYGVKDIETKEPVDENTLFMIASNSKLFTATALSQLEYKNKLRLNDKVTKYLPDFALYDTNVTALVTIRDMLSHRIGTKTFQGDFTFWNANLSRRAIINRMRTLKPPGIFRQDFGYCNSCYLTAGEIIPIVTQQPWEVYVYDSILMPLGMNNTHMLTNGMDQRSNVSKAYTSRYTVVNTELPYDRIDNIGPAGSMVSNINDLGKWLMMQLDSGRLQGRRILPWQVLQKTRDMQIATGSRKSSAYPTNYRGYGLGLFTEDYNGRQLYYHTGGAFGFFTNVSFVPEEKLGIAILTNKDNQNFFEALRLQITDAYLEVPYTNRSKTMLNGHLREEQREQGEIARWSARAKAASAPMLIDQYTGTFTNNTYGRIIITKASPTMLNVEFKNHSNLKATLEFMDNDEWMLTYNHKGYGVFSSRFTKDKGRVTSVEMKVTDFLELDPYIFIKEGS